jgi:ArsR family metal-binding transcriptional regulator
MARLIRGGAYRPDPPVLAIEEEHRLVAISPKEIVISRAKDLMDMWIILRTTVELFITAWEHRSSLEPEREPRIGIGAIEVFKRLPATNCGMCNNYSCMEFAAGLIAGRCRIEQCTPLYNGGDSRYLESLNWLMRAIGLAPGPP